MSDRLKDCVGHCHSPVPPCLCGRLPSTELQQTQDTINATFTIATALSLSRITFLPVTHCFGDLSVPSLIWICVKYCKALIYF